MLHMVEIFRSRDLLYVLLMMRKPMLVGLPGSRPMFRYLSPLVIVIQKGMPGNLLISSRYYRKKKPFVSSIVTKCPLSNNFWHGARNTLSFWTIFLYLITICGLL